MEYKDYMFKVDEQLALLGVGKGTGNYNKTDRDLIANSIIMLELINTLKARPAIETQEIIEESEAIKPKTLKKK